MWKGDAGDVDVRNKGIKKKEMKKTKGDESLLKLMNKKKCVCVFIHNKRERGILRQLGDD